MPAATITPLKLSLIHTPGEFIVANELIAFGKREETHVATERFSKLQRDNTNIQIEPGLLKLRGSNLPPIGKCESDGLQEILLQMY